MVLSDTTKSIIIDEKSKAVAFKVNDGDALKPEEINLLNVNGWVHDSSRAFVRRGFIILLYKRAIDTSLDGFIEMFGAALNNSEGCSHSGSAASAIPPQFSDEELIEMFNQGVNLEPMNLRSSSNGGRRNQKKSKRSNKLKKSKKTRKSTRRRR